jgi:uncharacterized RDD family membrane protein YckC
MERLDGTELATFSRRAWALVLDFILLMLISVLVQAAFGHVMTTGPDGSTTLNLASFREGYNAVWIVVYFAAGAYFGRGRTPGKWLLRIRIVSLAHDRLSLWGSVERALGYGMSALEFGFGFFQYYIHPNRRTVHDRLAETIVIRERKGSPPEGAPATE